MHPRKHAGFISTLPLIDFGQREQDGKAVGSRILNTEGARPQERVFERREQSFRENGNAVTSLGMRGGARMGTKLGSVLLLAYVLGAVCYVEPEDSVPLSNGNSPKGCMSFTRIKEGGHFWRHGTCFMYSGIGKARQTKLADSGIIPPRVGHPKVCHAVKGISFTGPELLDGNELIVESIEECCLRCQEKLGCKVYTFLENDGTCWLKTTFERPIISKEPCQTGIIDEAFSFALPYKRKQDATLRVDPMRMQWDFVMSGLLNQHTDIVWREFANPVDALGIAFGQYAYKTLDKTGKGKFSLTLASGKVFTFEAIATNQDKMFHILKIDHHTRDIIQSVNGNVNLTGSQLYFQLETQANAYAKLNCGFQGSVSPAKDKTIVLSVLKGFFKLMVENIKLRYGDGDCPHDFLKRPPQGSCNNLQNPTFGAANCPLRRLPKNDPSYKDGKKVPSGPKNISPRTISNTIADQGTDEDNATNKKRITDALITFGQLVSHDFVRQAEGEIGDPKGPRPFFSVSFDQFTEMLKIKIPSDDKHFEEGFFEFHRAVWIRENNTDSVPRAHRNLETSYLDLSVVYGSNSVREDALRSFSKGKLKTNKDGFLPFNGRITGGIGVALDNAPHSISPPAYVSGDIRCNVSPNLIAQHALWMKEHNKVASELDEAFGGSLSDEELFRFAKAITIAEYQSIIYTEYLTMILGNDALDPLEWRYDTSVDASVDAFFTAVVHRFGHSMINNFAWKVAKGQPTPVTQPTERFKMRELFFGSKRIDESSFGDWIRGMGWHEARELDEKVVDDLRNFLFTSDPRIVSSDLVTFNIQRARDLGLPMYNAAREAHGLEKVKRFEDVTCKKGLAQKLKKLYSTVDNIDPFIGGLAECPSSPDRLFGDLFHASMIRNYKKFRDGDRLFYKGLQINDHVYEKYPRLMDIMSDKVKLLDIVLRNTDSTEADFAGRSSYMHL